MSEKTILYIEDEEDYQLLVQRILGKVGFQVTVADTGAEGLKLLQATRPDLLLLDINLPDTDGYTICQQLRQDPSWADLPILMLTVRRRPEEWLQGFSSGANDYLSKPLNPPELVERVKNGLEGNTQQLASQATPEFQLIQAAVAGNRAAFEILIQKYKARLIESLRQSGRPPTEAEDIAAHAFLQAFESLATFRGQASFYTWLYRIAMNEAMLVHRRHQMVSMEEFAGAREAALPKALSENDSFLENLDAKDRAGRIHAALSEIPEPFRTMLDLYFLQDLSYEQIADRLDIPIGTVMSRLFKARRLLQERWTKESFA
jgi:RNA polymerase sigma-70 factor, ECF subfamily